MTDRKVRVSYTVKLKNKPEHISPEPQAFSSTDGKISFSRVDDAEIHRKHQEEIYDMCARYVGDKDRQIDDDEIEDSFIDCFFPDIEKCHYWKITTKQHRNLDFLIEEFDSINVPYIKVVLDEPETQLDRVVYNGMAMFLPHISTYTLYVYHTSEYIEKLLKDILETFDF
jgi:hypothetical protein